MLYAFLGFLWALTVGVLLQLGISPSYDEKRGTVIVSTIIAGVLGMIVSYLTMPTIGLFYFGFWFFILVPIVVSFLIVSMISMESMGRNRTITPIGFILPVTVVVGFIVFSFTTTSPIIHSQSYHNLLEVVEESEFDQDSILFDQSQARFVDQDLSRRAANEVLGKERGLASRYSVDTMRVQNIDSELRWLAPLVHSSFTRWLDDTTAPGYVSVSVSNYDDAKLSINEYEINYGNSGFYFTSDIDRHVYQNGYANVLFSDFVLELDDNGTPFWTASMLTPQVGFSGKVVTGVVTVDAKTGAIEEYTVGSAPTWIDRIQPESVVSELISDWGSYATGWWDAFVGNGVVAPTNGSSIVFTKDGSASWYTGMRSNSSSNKESSMGLMMVDTRTGVAKFYSRAGITENVAKATIEGRVQEASYTASFPIPYNIAGRTTFLSILKDRNGNMQGVGLVAYDDRSMVAVGNNFDLALRRYQSVLASNGQVSMYTDIETITILSTIDRSFVQDVDGRLVLNFTLADQEYNGLFFTVSADNNKGAMLARDGDNVEVSVMSLDTDNISVIEFTNMSLAK